jgi:hypothetical protein
MGSTIGRTVAVALTAAGVLAASGRVRAHVDYVRNGPGEVITVVELVVTRSTWPNRE